MWDILTKGLYSTFIFYYLSYIVIIFFINIIIITIINIFSLKLKQ